MGGNDGVSIVLNGLEYLCFPPTCYMTEVKEQYLYVTGFGFGLTSANGFTST